LRGLLRDLTELEILGIIIGILVATIPILEFVFGKDYDFPIVVRAIFGMAAVGIPLTVIIISRNSRSKAQLHVLVTGDHETESQNSITLTLGHPNSVTNKIQNYNTRNELPRFNEFLALASKKVEMSALTFSIVTLQHIGDIETTLNRGIKVTFFILRPKSTYLKKHSEVLHAAEDMDYQIDRSLEILCKLKEKLEPSLKRKLIIKTYSSDTNHSIIIIDNSIIKVEDRPKGSDSNSRPNHITFKKDNKHYFKQYLREHKNLAEVEDYKCK
jgi:hypothetical protein